MRLSQISFWFFILSMVGMGGVAIGIPILYIASVAILMGIVFSFIGFFTDTHIWIWRGIVCLFVLCGAVYALWYTSLITRGPSVSYYNEQNISGRVISYPRMSDATQSFLLKVSESVVSTRISSTYRVRYGDAISLRGAIEPLSSSTQYLARDGAIGTLSFGTLISITPPTSFSLLRTLYAVRDVVVGVFNKVFLRDQSALASGLLLGQQSASFSGELKNDMKQSGTTHLVALSGYNISIIIQVLYGIVGFWVSRNKSFLIMIVGIILFVCMTGAEASVVRAAFMSSLLLIAERLSRIYDFAQAMAVTAWIMVILNPLTAPFNIGFVLSFASLWGMSYLGPIFLSYLNRIPVLYTTHSKKLYTVIVQTLSQTLGAQIAVAPLLMVWFGGISISGVITNVVLLPLVPLVMGLSSFVALAGFLFLPFGWLASFVVSPLLSFFLWVIHVGAQFGFVTHTISWWVVALCYMVLWWIVIRYKKMSVSTSMACAV